MPIHFAWLFLMGLPLVVGLIVLVVYLATRPPHLGPPVPGAGPMPGGGPMPHRETPREILDRRLASGEITPEDYQKARDLLKD